MNIKIIEQFSVWSVDLGTKNDIKGHEQYGKRPFLVISDSTYNTTSKTPIGFIGSASHKKYKNDFTLPINLGNDRENSHINISQIRTLSEDRFIEKIIIDDNIKNLGIDAIQKFLDKIVKV